MHRRPAFTLVELLVVLAVIAVLVGLTLPAVQKVRAAAARTKCANNLHQLGLAAHHYHDSVNAFPAGMRYQGGSDPHRLQSWLAQLLPYLEQHPLWAATQDAYRRDRNPFHNPPHVGLATPVSVFVCPSDGRVQSPRRTDRSGHTVAFTNYLGVAGRDVFALDGMLFRDSRVRIADVADGTSQTLFAGERPPSADLQYGWWYAGAGQLFTGSADMILGVQERNILPATSSSCAASYAYGPGDLADQCAMFHFWSLHSGGAHFLLTDGSVRFLRYSADPLMPALATRSGGEAITIPD